MIILWGLLGMLHLNAMEPPSTKRMKIEDASEEQNTQDNLDSLQSHISESSSDVINLPKDIIGNFAKFADEKTRGRMAQVSKEWNDAVFTGRTQSAIELDLNNSKQLEFLEQLLKKSFNDGIAIQRLQIENCSLEHLELLDTYSDNINRLDLYLRINENNIDILDFLNRSKYAKKIAFLRLKGRIFLDLADLSGLTQLRSLIIETSYGIDNLSSLSGMSQLETLHLSDIGTDDLTPLTGLTKLQSLEVYSDGEIDLTPLAGLKQLKSLNVSDTKVINFSPLAGLTQLEALNLSNTGLKSLDPLSGLKQLKSLDVSGTEVTNLTLLAGLKQLERLHLDSTDVNDLKSLAGLFQLKELSVKWTKVVDLTPVEGLTRLKVIKH